MLTITIPSTEYFDNRNNTFSRTKETTINLEHSLISLSKWESKWHKPFINNKKKTSEEMLDYIKFMTIEKNVKDDIYMCLTKDNIDEIVKYIEDPMTATWFNERDNKSKTNSETMTSELIYYYMTAFNIPFDCEKWHINRLLTLIKICSIKNQPPKKMSKNDVISRNARLNAERKAKMHTHG